jgi:hypothetical protein
LRSRKMYCAFAGGADARQVKRNSNNQKGKPRGVLMPRSLLSGKKECRGHGLATIVTSLYGE